MNLDNTSSRWVDIGPEDMCPEGTGLEVVAEDQIIALFNVAGEYWALQGTCPHHGGPLGRGQLTGCVVTCPWHGWQFDVRDGTYQHSTQMQQPGFPVKVQEGRVWVNLAGRPQTGC